MVPPVVVEAFEGFAGIFDEEGFADAGGVHAEGKRRDARDGPEADGEAAGGQVAEVGEGAGLIKEGVGGVASGFAEEDVIGLVLDEHIEDHLGAPLELAGALLLTEVVPIDHEPGLGGIPEVVLQEVGPAEDLFQIGFEAIGRQEASDLVGGELAVRTDGQDEAVVIGGGDGIAHAESAEAESDDAGEGVVGGASDERVEEVVALAGRRGGWFRGGRSGGTARAAGA